MSRKKVPQFISSLDFEVPKEYNPVQFVIEDNELTITQVGVNFEEVTILSPEQALSLAYEIQKAYGPKPKQTRRKGNVVFLDFSKKNSKKSS